MSALDGSVPWARTTITRRTRTELVSLSLSHTHTLFPLPRLLDLLSFNLTAPPGGGLIKLFPVKLRLTEHKVACCSLCSALKLGQWSYFGLVVCVCCSRCHAGGSDQDVHSQAAGWAVPAGGRCGVGLSESRGRYVVRSLCLPGLCGSLLLSNRLGKLAPKLGTC